MTASIDDPNLSPGERITMHRKRRGLTQAQAAQLKGCSFGCWRKWESGERQVASLADWIEIARILKVKDLYLLTGLQAGQLPDDPAEHELVPPIRTALLEYLPRNGRPDVAAARRNVTWAWDSWHGTGN